MSQNLSTAERLVLKVVTDRTVKGFTTTPEQAVWGIVTKARIAAMAMILEGLFDKGYVALPKPGAYVTIGI